MHIVAPRPSNPELPVFFNVDGVVGAAPAANHSEDVLFVQFCFKGSGSPVPELVPVFQAVQLTGTMDPATLNAIRVTQERFRRNEPSVVVDGRVSPARGGYSYGGANWTIVQYNNILQDRHKDVWPRIDKIAGCPPSLAAAVIRVLVGN
jgi:hypothetical protein